jgi:UDP-3-O-[3-hydroxymyristoyl] glucosamine N-acyltransferase
MSGISLDKLAQQVQGKIVASTDVSSVLLAAVAALDAAGPTDVTFVSTEKHVLSAVDSDAGVIIVSQAFEQITKPQLIVDCVDRALIATLTLFAPQLLAPAPGIHSSACIAENAELGADVCVGQGVTIEDKAKIGDNVILGSGCRIGQCAQIGHNTRLDSNVVIYNHCQIGNHVVIQANTTIGAVGFGYTYMDSAHQLVPHNGAVIIEDFVDIGANCCIDRAKFANTIVGAGTKIDNLVQLGHNVIIGKCCLIAAQVGIAGSCKIGDGVVMAGQVGMADNLVIGDQVRIGAKAGVMNNISAGKTMMWTPAIEQAQAFRIVGELLRLPKTVKRLKQLTKRLDKLEEAENDKG